MTPAPTILRRAVRKLRSLVDFSPIRLYRRSRAAKARRWTDQRLAACLARAAFGSATRTLDPTVPSTWEFSGFSQNREDGITTFLADRLKRKTRYFVEIGASNGLENNTAILAYGLKYSGLMIDGNAALVRHAQTCLQHHNWGVRYRTLHVSRESARAVLDAALHPTPDVLSLDIDGNDYHVMAVLLEAGMRPQVVIVEYNSAFGPEHPITIPYQADFSYQAAHGSECYFGASIAAWRQLLEGAGYRFVTVESNGVNAFFVRPDAFEDGFIDSVQGVAFAENFAHCNRHGTGWENHFRLIEHLPLTRV